MSKKKSLLISTKWVGGVGGAERCLYSFCKSLHPFFDITIVTLEVIPSEFMVKSPEVTVHSFSSLFAYDTEIPHHFDLYFQIGPYAPYLMNTFTATQKYLSPAGNSVTHIEDYFDGILNQTDAGKSLLSDQSKHKVFPPPCFKMTEETTIVSGLPENFYLTVFNPYSCIRTYPEGEKECKGQDLLLDICNSLPHPLVWAYDMRTFSVDFPIKSLPSNCIPLSQKTQSELSYLYQNCKGYISFSREEGFGWSIADAILHQAQLFTRDIGVVTSLTTETRDQLYIYDTQETLLELINNDKENLIDYSGDSLNTFDHAKALLDWS
ncbi:hypothetical protein HOH87_04735 [bacterium]|jgi:hypothetical protein|nr:hypothetical protein [bacterium]